MKKLFDSFMRTIVNNTFVCFSVVVVIVLLMQTVSIYQLTQNNASQRVQIDQLLIASAELATKVEKLETAQADYALRMDTQLSGYETRLNKLERNAALNKAALASEARANKRLRKVLKQMRCILDEVDCTPAAAEYIPKKN